MPLALPTLDEIRDARARIAGTAMRTPLARLGGGRRDLEIFLKLENQQPIRSFKLRGAANAMALTSEEALDKGVWTASAGNMAQGVAWCARARGINCSVVVPDHAPRNKVEAVEKLGGTVIKVPFAEWWEALTSGRFAGQHGLYVHPFADTAVMAGNGTIALEILDDMKVVDAILVPYGGGGLACGIAVAAKAIDPKIKVYAIEVETAAPLTASIAAGAPVTIEYQRSFVDGIGSGGISPLMWPFVRQLLSGTIVVPIADVAAAIKMLSDEHGIVAEGAAGAPVAAALALAEGGTSGFDRVACIVSGGNIDKDVHAAIVRGEVP